MIRVRVLDAAYFPEHGGVIVVLAIGTGVSGWRLSNSLIACDADDVAAIRGQLVTMRDRCERWQSWS